MRSQWRRISKLVVLAAGLTIFALDNRVTDYWSILARGLGIAAPLFLIGRLQRSTRGRLSTGLIGLGYLLTITIAAIVSYSSTSVMLLVLLVAFGVFNIGRYASLPIKADQFVLGAALIAVAGEPIIAGRPLVLWTGELKITYATLLSATAFDLTPTWMRSYSTGLASHVDAPSIPLQITISLFTMSCAFVLTALVLRSRPISNDLRYLWAAALSLGCVFLVLPNHVLLLAVAVLATYLGARWRRASPGLGYACVFRPLQTGKMLDLWAFIAVGVLLYHLIYAHAAIAVFRRVPGVGMNWLPCVRRLASCR